MPDLHAFQVLAERYDEDEDRTYVTVVTPILKPTELSFAGRVGFGDGSEPSLTRRISDALHKIYEQEGTDDAIRKSRAGRETGRPRKFIA